MEDLSLTKEKAEVVPLDIRGSMKMLKPAYITTVSVTIAPEEGLYMSQDPIGLAGGDRFYGYVHDPNGWSDPLGLSSACNNDATKDLTYNAVYNTDNYNEQRGLEHKVYEQHESTASKENGGLNQIKAISDQNRNKDTYIKAADDFLNKQK